MNIFSIIGISLIFLIISNLIKKYLPEYFVIFIISSVLFVFIMIIPDIKSIINDLDLLFRVSKNSERYQFVVLKTIGICMVSQFASDICKDSGNLSLSNVVSVFGRISVIIVSMPMIKFLFETTIDIIKGMQV